MDASQYKDYVLTLLFMKYVSDKYADIDDPYPDIVVPPGGGFGDMAALKGTKNIGDQIDTVISRLADANGSLLKGVIDQASPVDGITFPQADIILLLSSCRKERPVTFSRPPSTFLSPSSRRRP